MISILPPDASRLPERHRRFAIVSEISYLRDASLSRFEASNRIVVKEFLSQVVNPEGHDYYVRNLDKVWFYFPKRLYDPSKPDKRQIREASLPDDWYLTVALDQCMFYSFRLVYVPGCDHYACGCEYWCGECYEFFGCKYCHNQQSDHTLYLRAVEKLRCRFCGLEQPCGPSCAGCGVDFGVSGTYCSLCGQHDYRGMDQCCKTHCPKCDVCYNAGPEDLIHCDKCSTCLTREMYKAHACVGPLYCSVCFENSNDSNHHLIICPCGHAVHGHCRHKMLMQNLISCSICRRFLYEGQERDAYFALFYKMYLYLYVQNFSAPLAVFRCNECACKFLHKQISSSYIIQCPCCGFYNSQYDGQALEDMSYPLVDLTQQQVASRFVESIFADQCKVRFDALHDFVNDLHFDELIAMSYDKFLQTLSFYADQRPSGSP